MNASHSKRIFLALALLASMTGCALKQSTDTPPTDDTPVLAQPGATPDAPNKSKVDCKHSSHPCKYEGAYERGETRYAVVEARRLNQAALAKFREAIK